MSLSLEPFFETSLDLLCIAGYDGYFKKINPAFVALLEYTEKELFSKKISEFIYIDDRALTSGFRKNLTESVPLLNFENRYMSKSGKIIWFHWTSIPLPEENLIYAIAKDITYKKKLEEERVIHLLKLDENNKQLKTLNYKTSHDLRSPVNNLLTLCNLLDASKITDQETIKIFELIKLSAEGMKVSLDDYIDSLAKTEKIESDLENVYFENVLKQVELSIGALIQGANASIDSDFSELESIHYNRSYLESIFLNFITNSIKYARPDFFPDIHIKTKLVGELKMLIYTDNGLGFDMEIVGNKIFNLNQRFHSNADSKGVGLYLVHNHITTLGGSITVQSKVNEGTTFTICFT